MEFSSVDIARAAFALGPVSFDCLICSDRHNWTGSTYDYSTKYCQRVARCNSHALRVFPLISFHKQNLIDSEWLNRWEPAMGADVLIPSPLEWVYVFYPESAAARQLLIDSASRLVAEKLTSTNDKPWFDVDKYRELCKHYRSLYQHVGLRMPACREPTLCALTSRAAQELLMPMVVEERKRKCSLALDLVQFLDMPDLYEMLKQFLDTYCTIFFPPEEVWFVSSGYAGFIAEGMGKIVKTKPFTAMDTPNGFCGIVDSFVNLIGFSMHNGAWRGHTALPGRPVAIKYTPERTWIIGQQMGSKMQMAYTDDYIYWHGKIADLQELPLAQIDSYLIA